MQLSYYIGMQPSVEVCLQRLVQSELMFLKRSSLSIVTNLPKHSRLSEKITGSRLSLPGTDC